MKKLFLFHLVLLPIISIYGQQWNGSTDANGTIYRNGYIGISTSPSQKLHIQGGHSNSRILLHSTGGGMDTKYADLMLWASEPGLTYSGVGIGNNVINTSVSPYLQRINNQRGGSYIRLLDGKILMNIIKNNGDNINIINLNELGNVGIGTANPAGYRLAVNGKIRAKEIKVETGWSDFVFEKEYQLPTLKEVEKHIKQKGHLKDIPSAKEVAKNGVLLGEMNSKLLLKIEELTLYAIKQQKEIEKLKLIEERLVKIEKILSSKN
jgi:hypothetical protein